MCELSNLHLLNERALWVAVRGGITQALTGSMVTGGTGSRVGHAQTFDLDTY